MDSEELERLVLEDSDVYDELLKEYGRQFLEEESDDGVYDMDSYNLTAACGDDAMDIVQRVIWGGRHENPEAKFDPSAEYFYVDGYGNLMSLRERDLNGYLHDQVHDYDFAKWCVRNGYVDESDFEEV